MTQLNFQQNFNALRGVTFAPTVGSLSFIPFKIEDYISFNSMQMVAVGAADVRIMSVSAGLYSLNAGTLSLANSASGYTSLPGNGAALYFSFATSATQNISPGDWWFGIVVTSVVAVFSFLGQKTFMSAGNAFPGAFIGGAMTESTNNIPSSYATSNLNTTGLTALSIPYIIISA